MPKPGSLAEKGDRLLITERIEEAVCLCLCKGRIWRADAWCYCMQTSSQ